MGLYRDSYRNPPVADQQTVSLSAAIIDTAQVSRGFGYRRIHGLLRPKFPNVNHKRMYRLYRVADLAVRKRKKAKRPTNQRLPLQIAIDLWDGMAHFAEECPPTPYPRASSSILLCGLTCVSPGPESCRK